MKTLSLILIPVLFLSFSGCAVKKPEITLPEAPAGELVRALEQRRQSFSGLKAVASAQVVRKGRKRSYDTVGVALEAQRKFRIEAYGPLGQSLLVLVWDGKEALFRLSGQDAVMRPGPSALEQLLGVGMEMSDLCAVLSGNIPDAAGTAGAKAFCGQDGACVVELRQGEITRRAWIKRPPPESAGQVKLRMYEVYRSEGLLFRATFEQVETISGYPLPMKVVLENPDKNVILAVSYNDVDVNVPIDASLFTLADGEGADP